jgi:hypothetical protein
VTASRGRSLHREHVVAACLAGAVVVVVGYASGVGLKTTPAGADTSVTADGGKPTASQAPPAQQPIPAGQPPAPDAGQPMPAMPGPAGPPAGVPPVAAPITDVPPVQQPPQGPDPVPPGSTDPGVPSTPPNAPVPPGTPVPIPGCQPGLVQPITDAATGLPLVGGLTTGLGLTGPSGVLAALVGSCQPQPGQPPALWPAGLSPAPAALTSGG